jgi:hypothetical protein
MSNLQVPVGTGGFDAEEHGLGLGSTASNHDAREVVNKKGKRG